MDALERLLAIEEIKTLKARYWRAIDMKDEALLHSVFTEDAEFDLRGSSSTDPEKGTVTRDRNVFVANAMRGLRDLVTAHHGHAPEITLTGEDSATGVWPMEDNLWAKEGTDPGYRHMRGWGHYHDRYTRTADGWKVSAMRLIRIRLEIH